MKPTYDWKPFLTNMSQQLVDSADEFEFEVHEDEPYYDALLATKWLGFPGASEAQLAEAEGRLDVSLPPDYRQFLQVSNGWRAFGGYPCGLAQACAIEQVCWLKDHPRDYSIFDGYVETVQEHYAAEVLGEDEYFNYDYHDSRHYHSFREDHMRASLRIGGFDGNEILVLNPLATTPADEWEAWTYHHEEGVTRYPSWWMLLYDIACLMGYPADH